MAAEVGTVADTVKFTVSPTFTVLPFTSTVPTLAVFFGGVSGFSFFALNWPTEVMLPWPVVVSATIFRLVSPLTVVATTAGVPVVTLVSPVLVYVSVTRYQPSPFTATGWDVPTWDAATVRPLPSAAGSELVLASSVANLRICSAVNVATYAAGLLAYSAGMLFLVSLSAASAAVVTAVFHASTVFTSTVPLPAFANVANLYGVYVWPACALLTCSNGVVICGPSACALAAPRAMPPSSVTAAAIPAKSFLIFMRILSSLLFDYLFLQSREVGTQLAPAIRKS